MPDPQPDDLIDLELLAAALAEVGRAVRDAVRSGEVGGVGHDGHHDDHRVVRTEGGDDVFGVDARAEAALVTAFEALGDRWPGTAVVEGHDEPLVVGDPGGPWRYIVDPVDGTRGLLAGKRSAWVLLGAGREAETLEDLEVGAAVEIPTRRAAVGLVAHAAVGRPGPRRRRRPHRRRSPAPARRARAPRRRPGPAVRHRRAPGPRLARADRGVGRPPPRRPRGLRRPGARAPAATSSAWPPATTPRCSTPGRCWCRATSRPTPTTWRRSSSPGPRAPSSRRCRPGPLDVPLDCTTPVAWAGYADAEVAARLRPTPRIAPRQPPGLRLRPGGGRRPPARGRRC